MAASKSVSPADPLTGFFFAAEPQDLTLDDEYDAPGSRLAQEASVANWSPAPTVEIGSAVTSTVIRPRVIGGKTIHECDLLVPSTDTFAALYDLSTPPKAIRPTPYKMAVLAQTKQMAKLAFKLFNNMPNTPQVFHIGKKDFRSKKGKVKSKGPETAQAFMNAPRSMVFSETTLGSGAFANLDCIIHLGLPTKADCEHPLLHALTDLTNSTRQLQTRLGWAYLKTAVNQSCFYGLFKSARIARMAGSLR